MLSQLVPSGASNFDVEVVHGVVTRFISLSNPASASEIRRALASRGDSELKSVEIDPRNLIRLLAGAYVTTIHLSKLYKKAEEEETHGFFRSNLLMTMMNATVSRYPVQQEGKKSKAAAGSGSKPTAGRGNIFSLAPTTWTDSHVTKGNRSVDSTLECQEFSPDIQDGVSCDEFLTEIRNISLSPLVLALFVAAGIHMPQRAQDLDVVCQAASPQFNQRTTNSMYVAEIMHTVYGEEAAKGKNFQDFFNVVPYLMLDPGEFPSGTEMSSIQEVRPMLSMGGLVGGPVAVSLSHSPKECDDFFEFVTKKKFAEMYSPNAWIVRGLLQEEDIAHVMFVCGMAHLDEKYEGLRSFEQLSRLVQDLDEYQSRNGASPRVFNKECLEGSLSDNFQLARLLLHFCFKIRLSFLDGGHRICAILHGILNQEPHADPRDIGRPFPKYFRKLHKSGPTIDLDALGKQTSTCFHWLNISSGSLQGYCFREFARCLLYEKSKLLQSNQTDVRPRNTTDTIMRVLSRLLEEHRLGEEDRPDGHRKRKIYLPGEAQPGLVPAWKVRSLSFQRLLTEQEKTNRAELEKKVGPKGYFRFLLHPKDEDLKDPAGSSSIKSEVPYEDLMSINKRAQMVYRLYVLSVMTEDNENPIILESIKMRRKTREEIVLDMLNGLAKTKSNGKLIHFEGGLTHPPKYVCAVMVLITNYCYNKVNIRKMMDVIVRHGNPNFPVEGTGEAFPPDKLDKYFIDPLRCYLPFQGRPNCMQDDVSFIKAAFLDPLDDLSDAFLEKLLEEKDSKDLQIVPRDSRYINSKNVKHRVHYMMAEAWLSVVWRLGYRVPCTAGYQSASLGNAAFVTDADGDKILLTNLGAVAKVCIVFLSVWWSSPPKKWGHFSSRFRSTLRKREGKQQVNPLSFSFPSPEDSPETGGKIGVAKDR